MERPAASRERAGAVGDRPGRGRGAYGGVWGAFEVRLGSVSGVAKSWLRDRPRGCTVVLQSLYDYRLEGKLISADNTSRLVAVNDPCSRAYVMDVYRYRNLGTYLWIYLDT